MCKGCASKLRWLWQFCGSTAWNRPFVQRQSPRPWPSFCHVHSSLSFGVDRSTVSLLILMLGPGRWLMSTVEKHGTTEYGAASPCCRCSFLFFCLFLALRFTGVHCDCCKVSILDPFHKAYKFIWVIPFLSSFKLLSDYSTQLHYLLHPGGSAGTLEIASQKRVENKKVHSHRVCVAAASF